MSQILTNPAHYAEMDFEGPNGGHVYASDSEEVTITVGFADPVDTVAKAVLVLQTPRNGSCGGEGIAVQADGSWEYQHYTPDASGYCPGPDPINCSAIPAPCGSSPMASNGTFIIHAKIADGMLSVDINSQHIGSWAVQTPGIPSVVELQVERPGGSSGAVEFSAFSWSGFLA